MNIALSMHYRADEAVSDKMRSSYLIACHVTNLINSTLIEKHFHGTREVAMQELFYIILNL